MKMSNEKNGQAVVQVFSRLIKGFTNFHDNLVTDVSELDSSITISVQAHADDTRKLIGAGGVHYRSLVIVFANIAHKWCDGKSFRLTIQEPVKGVQLALTPFVTAKNWDSAPSLAMLTDVCDAMFGSKYKVKHQPQGGDSSTFEVVIASDAPPKLAFGTDAEVGEALSRLFNAIGKSSGRKLYVDLVRERKGKRNENETGITDRV